MPSVPTFFFFSPDFSPDSLQTIASFASFWPLWNLCIFNSILIYYLYLKPTYKPLWVRILSGTSQGQIAGTGSSHWGNRTHLGENYISSQLPPLPLWAERMSASSFNLSTCNIKSTSSLQEIVSNPICPAKQGAGVIADRARPHGSPYVMDILRGTEWTPCKVYENDKRGWKKKKKKKPKINKNQHLVQSLVKTRYCQVAHDLPCPYVTSG